ncbi:MAG: hypothetical protein L0216_14345 [Planctomycetales bacterium]|nr:hypothetical protein [Planctomycetales bacterium]
MSPRLVPLAAIAALLVAGYTIVRISGEAPVLATDALESGPWQASDPAERLPPLRSPAPAGADPPSPVRASDAVTARESQVADASRRLPAPRPRYTREEGCFGVGGGIGGSVGGRWSCGGWRGQFCTLHFDDETPAPGVSVLREEDGRIFVADESGQVPREAFDSRTGDVQFWRDGVRLHVWWWSGGVIRIWRHGRTVLGRVVDEGGRPLPEVRVSGFRVRGLGPERVVTDGSGMFRADDVTPSSLDLQLEGPELLPDPLPREVPLSRGATEVVLRAVRGQTAALRVLDHDGVPIAGLVVRYRAWDEEECRRNSGKRERLASSDASGRAALLLAPGRPLEAEVVGKYGAVEARVFAEGARLGADLPVRLPSRFYSDTSPWIPVRARDAISGAGLARAPALVLVRRPDRPWQRPWDGFACQATCHPDDEPDFRVLDVRGLEPGSTEVFLWVPGYRPAVVAAEATREGIYPPAEVSLSPVDDIVTVGAFDHANGERLTPEGITVEPVPDQGEFLSPAIHHQTWSTGDSPGRERTEDGGVRFRLPAGRYRIRAQCWRVGETLDFREGSVEASVPCPGELRVPLASRNRR